MDDRLAANRANWDERVPIHASSDFYDVEGWLAGDREPRPWEAEVIGDVAGLDLVHLQCHFGQDTLTWAQRGARVVGLDFSSAAIAQARDLAARSGLEDRARFVEANVLDAASVLAPDTFDLVYVSLGAIIWLPSVAEWAAQVRALLRPGGRLFLHEVHPLSGALGWDDPVAFEAPYFEEPEPSVDDHDATYTDGDVRLVNTRTYEWNHSIGDTVTALLDEGLRLDRLVEHDWTVFERFPWLVRSGPERWEFPPDRPRFPLSLTIVATLPEH